MIKAKNFFWAGERGLNFSDSGEQDFKPDIVFYFFDKRISRKIDAYSILKERFPKSILFGCSTSGPVLNDDIYLNTFTGIAASFEKTQIKSAQIECPDQKFSDEAGKRIVSAFAPENLQHIFVVTDGMTVNGSRFIDAANKVLPNGVSISGGLSSDGFDFSETLSGINTQPATGQVCALGFYGDSIQVGYAAQGGWDKFGLERVVTKSDGALLYELDGKPALDLYKEYLGDAAEKLPSSGLLFPLAIRKTETDDIMVRTINAVDEDLRTLRFTGDIPQGYIAQFMKGNFKNLSSGAAQAAREALQMTQNDAGFALLVSCLGRQLLMGNQISDELEAVQKILGNTPSAGFYSNGELSYDRKALGILHNETMTITVFQEK